MAIEFGVEGDPKALKDSQARRHNTPSVSERAPGAVTGPRVPGDALHGMKDCYKIKLRGEATDLCTALRMSLVLAVGEREGSSVYEQAGKR